MVWYNPFMMSDEIASSERDARTAWWREARFGMFIHWGLYAVPAGVWRGRVSRTRPSEWIMNERMIPDRVYCKLAAQFNPVEFDADAWAAAAAQAGMKYLVFTTKHHDGFCMFHTRQSDYNIVDATPFGRDAVAELSRACRDHGLRFGIYYSQLDWHHAPLPAAMPWIPRFEQYVDVMKGHLEELLTNYGPVSVLFFDGDWMPQWLLQPGVGRDIEAFCRRLQPDVIINNRVGTRSVFSIMPWMEPLTRNTSGGDYETPEQFVMKTPPRRDWETCMTMNGSWGHHARDRDWKSTRTLLQHLVDACSKGGNFLLNVGPDRLGRFPGACTARLRRLGRWLERNGDAVYGTSAGLAHQPPWGRITRKRDRIYLHIFDVPRSGVLDVRGATSTPATARLLGHTDKTVLKIVPAQRGFHVHLPDVFPDPLINVIEVNI